MNTLIIIAMIVILSLADFGTTILCTRWMGSALTYTLFAVPMLIGLLIQWRRWQVMKAAEAQRKNLSDEERWQVMPKMMTEMAAWSIISVLLLIPGLVTAGIAFGLMFTPIHKILEQCIFHYFSQIQVARNLAQKSKGSTPDQLTATQPDN